MTENTLISVIVPVYNVENYLAACMDSLIHQTYPYLEIICIDDGSTDHSVAILEQYAERDSRIKVVLQKNHGVSSARNRGLREASGDYIMFLDSDDWIDCETCENAMKVITQYRADIVMWGYVREYQHTSKKVFPLGNKISVWSDTETKDLYRRMVGLVGTELSDPQKVDSIVTVWGKLYSRHIVESIEFVDIKRLGTQEDALYNMMVFCNANTVVYLPQAYSHYRKFNAASLTHQYKRRLAEQWKELYSLIFHHLNCTDAAPIFYEALSNRICLGLIGLGLNLAEDQTMHVRDKIYELDKILTMQHYRDALGRLSLCYFPIHWKLFFLFAKKRNTRCLYILLVIMNRLRG